MRPIFCPLSSIFYCYFHRMRKRLNCYSSFLLFLIVLLILIDISILYWILIDCNLLKTRQLTSLTHLPTVLQSNLIDQFSHVGGCGRERKLLDELHIIFYAHQQFGVHTCSIPSYYVLFFQRGAYWRGVIKFNRFSWKKVSYRQILCNHYTISREFFLFIVSRDAYVFFSKTDATYLEWKSIPFLSNSSTLSYLRLGCAWQLLGDPLFLIFIPLFDLMTLYSSMLIVDWFELFMQKYDARSNGMIVTVCDWVKAHARMDIGWDSIMSRKWWLVPCFFILKKQ